MQDPQENTPQDQQPDTLKDKIIQSSDMASEVLSKNVDQVTGRQPAGKPSVDPSGKPLAKKAPKKANLLFIFLGIFLFLFLLFLTFLVVMLLQNNGNNPLLTALGVEPALLKTLLSTLVSLVFGFLSFVSFIVMVVGLFRRLTSAKAEVEKKRSSLIMAVVSGLFGFFCVFLWLLLYFYISQLQVGAQGSTVILSEPEQTINMTAPVAITFSAREIETLFFREGIVSYSWDLDGDGSYDDGNGRDIQYSYESRGNADGIYNVSVKVLLNNGESVVAEKLVTIANVLADIRVGIEPSKPEAGQIVRFDASESRDPDGSIISYDWDFDGDGVSDAQGSNASSTFENPGVRQVLLKVTDNNGEVAEELLEVVIGDARPRGAQMDVRPGLEGSVPFEVSFDATESLVGDKIKSYTWDFADGSALSRGKQTTHRFEKPGTYEVKLLVIAEDGTESEKVETITVNKAQLLPTAALQIDGVIIDRGKASVSAPATLSFDASASRDADGEIVEFHWDFDGDGREDAISEQAEFTYVQEGSFEVELRVVDNDGREATDTVTLIVDVPVVLVNLEAVPQAGSVPLEVVFDASGSQAQEGKIVSYTWDFGDESPEIIGSARQTHLYNQVGEYFPKVTVLTDENKRVSKEVLVVVRDLELQASFSINPPELIAGQKVFFDASLSQGQISRYYWEFGDGGLSRVVKPEHSYSEPGKYKVLLEISDRKDRVSRFEMEIDVLPAE